jgi:hexosaminidase
MNAHRGRTQLTPEGRKRIRGIQGQLWHEVLRDFSQTSYALFPKMFGLVERAWNAEPEWSLTNNPETERRLRQADLSLYYAKIFQRELPWLVNQHGMTIRINPPGFKIIDGMLYMNNVNPAAEMRFTTDGTEPTIHSPLWTAPVRVSPTAPIRARAFFLNHESVTILERAID